MKARISPLGFATLAALVALSSLPASAQPYDDNEIVVIPYGVQRVDRDRSSGPVPIDTLAVTHRVSTADLDLRYDDAVAELHRRVVETARTSCNELDRAARGVVITTDRECMRHAIDAAMPQADAAVYRARSYASLK